MQDRATSCVATQRAPMSTPRVSCRWKPCHPPVDPRDSVYAANPQRRKRHGQVAILARRQSPGLSSLSFSLCALTPENVPRHSLSNWLYSSRVGNPQMPSAPSQPQSTTARNDPGREVRVLSGPIRGGGRVRVRGVQVPAFPRLVEAGRLSSLSSNRPPVDFAPPCWSGSDVARVEEEVNLCSLKD